MHEVAYLFITFFRHTYASLYASQYMHWTNANLCICACASCICAVFKSCDAMAAASVTRPGSAQTTEKSQLTLKGNHPSCSSQAK